MTYRLVYRQLDTGGPGPDVLALHAEAQRVDVVLSLLGAAGARRVVAPYGDWSITPSGMAQGGLCWYRHQPGVPGADPISLTRAVLQVHDLVVGLGAAAPRALVGFGQGAAVALGVGRLLPDRIDAAACVDLPEDHVAALPPAPCDGDAGGGGAAAGPLTVARWSTGDAGDRAALVARLARWLSETVGAS